MPASTPTLLDLVRAVDEAAESQEEAVTVLQGLLSSRRVRWLHPQPLQGTCTKRLQLGGPAPRVGRPRHPAVAGAKPSA